MIGLWLYMLYILDIYTCQLMQHLKVTLESYLHDYSVYSCLLIHTDQSGKNLPNLEVLKIKHKLRAVIQLVNIFNCLAYELRLRINEWLWLGFDFICCIYLIYILVNWCNILKSHLSLTCMIIVFIPVY
jgi:hypothetical protein